MQAVYIFCPCRFKSVRHLHESCIDFWIGFNIGTREGLWNYVIIKCARIIGLRQYCREYIYHLRKSLGGERPLYIMISSGYIIGPFIWNKSLFWKQQYLLKKIFSKNDYQFKRFPIYSPHVCIFTTTKEDWFPVKLL